MVPNRSPSCYISGVKLYIKLILVILSVIFCCTSILIQIHEFDGDDLIGVYWIPAYVIFIVTSVILLSGYLINFTASKCYSKALVSLCLVLFFTTLGIIIAGAVGFRKFHSFSNMDGGIPIFCIWGASLGAIISIKRFFK